MAKAQPSGAAVASLIGIITIIMIFYILFLPPEERERLLAEETITPSTSETRTPIEEHKLPLIHLFESEKAVVITTINPFLARKTIFGEDIKNQNISVSKPENIQNAVLTFQAPTRNGILEIWFNGVTIFEKRVLQETAEPIQIPINLLHEQNVLTFKVKGGIFESKEYLITDAKILADVLEKKRMQATTSFVVTAEEIREVDKEFLTFTPRCRETEPQKLTIKLNGKNIYAQAPPCEKENRVEIARQELKVGRNTLDFELEKGNVALENLRVKTGIYGGEEYIRGTVFERFDVSRRIYRDIQDGKKDIELIVRFSERNRNRADVEINGRSLRVDYRGSIYIKDISQYVEEGTNNVRVISTTTPIESIDVDIV